MDDKFEMIKDRISHILRAKNLTATQFAELMQIQPSNVSHILNGRNKPSLDFIMRLKDVFPEYSFDWIIMGKKPITISDHNNFSNESDVDLVENNQRNKIEFNDPFLPLEFNASNKNATAVESNIIDLQSQTTNLKQIIYVYEDHTFEVYNLRK